MNRVARTIFRLRFPLLSLLTLLTLFLGFHASRLRVATDFRNMVPARHNYIRDYEPYKAIFGGGNQIRLALSRRDGTILTADFLATLRRVTEDVMYVKGVDRLTVRSLVSPETRILRVNEEGFEMGPVVPDRIPQDPDGLAAVYQNILLARLKGRLVAMDFRSALITAEVYEKGVDYLAVYRQLNQIRDRYTTGDLTLHINGFAMVVGFVNDALPKIVGLFGLSILLTLAILCRCFRHPSLALLPLLSGGLSVLWSLGLASLAGLALDPMTTIVPFLVLAIGVSHGIQMVNRYLEECAVHRQGYDAAMHALAGLLVPGVVALGTDVAGFLTILLVPIGVIRELALTASVGIGCIIVANILVLTLVLSFFPNLLARERKPAEQQTRRLVFRLFDTLARVSYGRNAWRVLAASSLLLLIGMAASRSLTVGDVNPGEPLLWEESTYNRDAKKIMADFLLGVDWLSVVVAGDQDGTCKNLETLRLVKDFEWEVGSTPGVTVVLSPLILGETVNELLHEGDIRWRALPQQQKSLGYVMIYGGSDIDSEFMTMGCQNLNVRFFLSDHKGDTIRRVMQAARTFIDAHPLPGARFVLAGGNAGVMAATNEVVCRAQAPMLGLVYLSVFALCLLMFRSWRAPLFVIAPLLLVSVMVTALMRLFGLGLNVNTLPVSALGVGVGVDYGIYIYARLREELRAHSRFADAVRVTLQTTGAAVLYTGLTLSAGVLTWLFSDLKFQADMGLLLGFIFLGNMVGAVVLLPALVWVFEVRSNEQPESPATAAGGR